MTCIVAPGAESWSDCTATSVASNAPAKARWWNTATWSATKFRAAPVAAPSFVRTWSGSRRCCHPMHAPPPKRWHAVAISCSSSERRPRSTRRLPFRPSPKLPARSSSRSIPTRPRFLQQQITRCAGRQAACCRHWSKRPGQIRRPARSCRAIVPVRLGLERWRRCVQLTRKLPPHPRQHDDTENQHRPEGGAPILPRPFRLLDVAERRRGSHMSNRDRAKRLGAARMSRHQGGDRQRTRRCCNVAVGDEKRPGSARGKHYFLGYPPRAHARLAATHFAGFAIDAKQPVAICGRRDNKRRRGDFAGVLTKTVGHQRGDRTPRLFRRRSCEKLRRYHGIDLRQLDRDTIDRQHPSQVELVFVLLVSDRSAQCFGPLAGGLEQALAE